MNFNPRAPRGARPLAELLAEGDKNFNPRAPRGARPTAGYINDGIYDISIHVPREGHDFLLCFFFFPFTGISIHVPREGHDISLEVISTIPIDFNPRAPRGARLAAWDGIKTFFTISIHVPREGHD